MNKSNITSWIWISKYLPASLLTSPVLILLAQPTSEFVTSSAVKCRIMSKVVLDYFYEESTRYNSAGYALVAMTGSVGP